MHELDEAVASSDDRERCLALLLGAWQIRRDPRIVPLIDELSAVVTATRVRPAGKRPIEKHKAWLALAARKDPGDVGVLVATLTDTRFGDWLHARMQALLDRPADPRIADAMFALVRSRMKFGSDTTAGLRLLALQGLVAIGDPRTKTAFGDDVLGNNFDAVYTPLAPDEVAAVEALATKLAETRAPPARHDLATLFAAVYANPSDDAPRLVLADYLQEQGDPRGELIALQVVRGRRSKATPRERELLAAYTTEWLGPLAAELRAHPSFERGFLALCAVLTTTRPQVLAWPAMATVVTLDVGAWGFFPFAAAVLPALRHLRGVTADDVSDLEPLFGSWVIEQLDSLAIDIGARDPNPWYGSLALLPPRIRVELRQR